MAVGEATAFLFSGRPDPTWQVPEATVVRLESLWSELPPVVGPVPEPPGLGYRGSVMRVAAGPEYRVYGGVVTRRAGDASESRADRGARFEALVLESAPAGAVPPDLLPPQPP